MKLIAITGGIGSGKSVVARLVQVMGHEVYDCDSRAKALMTENDEVRHLLIEAFGKETYHNDGTLNRQHLSEVAFGDDKALARLNGIVRIVKCIDRPVAQIAQQQIDQKRHHDAAEDHQRCARKK